MCRINISMNLLTIKKLIFLSTPLFLLSGCANMEGLSNISNLLKPTTVAQVTFKPVCKKSWHRKTIFIDFKTNHSYWRYASNLAVQIKDQLMEDVIEDGCFHVQDRNTGRRYFYKVGVRVANPHILVNQRSIISKVSARYRIKTYDHRGNLVTAMTRDVSYKRPMFVVVTSDSQSELLSNYAHNVSVEIRKAFYKSLRDNLK